jgi:uncharacterized surface protein with fasciclin (FAS1) repeats
MKLIHYNVNAMKLIIYKKTIDMVPKGMMIMLLGVALLVQSCYKSDDVGSNYVTFTGEMMGGYLKSRPEYSEFAKMLDTTKVMGLLNAYGNYTCFAPTNEAVLKFYQKRGHSSINDFPFDSIVKVVYDHIIKDAVITSSDFTNGRLTSLSMSDRYISTKLAIDDKGLPIIYVDVTSPILQKDLKVHNGVIHEISEVLQPTDLRLPEVIKKDLKFKLFYQALNATGLDNELVNVVDKSYVPDPNFAATGTTSKAVQPLTRKYGYTALIESDSVYNLNGIKSLDDMKAYAKKVYDQVYPNDAGITDITDRKNSLNRFVAYHLMNKQLSYKKFIYDLDNDGAANPTKTHSVKNINWDMFEYIETMCPNTLMEVRTSRVTNENYGLFNNIVATGKAVRINSNYKDKDALNGVYHEIDNILAYSKEFVSELTSKRLRLDVASFFPEFTNNNWRANKVSQFWVIPKKYVERISTSDYTVVNYLNADDRFLDFQGDEIFIPADKQFDFTITTLPIPAGTYEVRFGYLSNGKRGVTQLYWDGQPCGIPLDLNLPTSDPKIGNVVPGSDLSDPDGFENDKMMRNRGYMKGPASFNVIDDVWQSGPGRVNPNCIRRILGIYTFKEDGTHTIRAKSASTGEFMFDYLEFVPLEYIEHEGIE